MAKKVMQNTGIVSIEGLAQLIGDVNQYFLSVAQRQVNTALTLRNWIIGCYIIEYEQKGADRAAYGEKVLSLLASQLKNKGVKGMSETNLKLYRQFFIAYPLIGQTLSDQLEKSEELPFLQNVPVPSKTGNLLPEDVELPASLLLNQLSFSHFIELLKAEDALKRRFYAVETIKNQWSVRDLKRAINSMLYERTGLSKDKKKLLQEVHKSSDLHPEDVFRNPYILEFLNLEERPSYSENDLEQAIIDHLQSFLLEMGRGFCFEARQKRITFDNTHYRIDLVFYHRILKCHVLVDLKIGEFSHADAGQMNVYLNYYKENEWQKGDNDPVGIILCATKNEQLVKYATMGLSQKVFVSKYMVNLPSEKELESIIREEQQKLEI